MDNGFIIVKNLYDVNNHTLKIKNLFDYTKTLNVLTEGDSQVPFAPAYYNDIEVSKVQIKLLNKIENLTNLKLYPTYNYFRIYNRKSILERHVDRPACEISVTMNIGYEGNHNWSIWIKGNDNKDYEVKLNAGDGLIYKGCENEHWRDNATDEVICQSQVFLHYVRQDNKYENCINDRRDEY